jgi:hypothetical protein
MFKQSFFLGIIAGIAATIACLLYSNFYFSIIVDFSEATTLSKVAAGCFGFTMIAAFLQFGLGTIVKNTKLADFIVSLIIAIVSISLVFYVLKMDDPEFKNEDAQLFVDYFKGFLMPMLFFPALGWFTFKPLFRK